MIVEYLKTNNISVEQISDLLVEILKYNQNLNSNLEKENREFAKVMKNRQVFVESTLENQPIIDISIPVKYSESTNSEVDISYYKTQIDNCSNLSELESLLPHKTSDNFMELINQILLALLEEEMEFRQLIHKEGKLLESDAEVCEYVSNLHQKFEIIKKYRDDKQNDNQEILNEVKNDLIFLTTNYGNVCALSDIKDIDSEYYEDFLRLLESIVDGTFRNAKSFVLQGSGSLISEVKDFKTRILFTKLEPKVYLITSIFVKKSDCGLSYINNLTNRDSLYRNKINSIKQQLNSPNRKEYLRQNEMIKEEVIQTLKSGIKVKNLGDNSGKVN